MKKKVTQLIGISVLLMVLLPTLAISAEQMELSLEEAIDMALERNHEILLVQSEVDMIKGDAAKANAVFLPQVTLSEMYAKTNDPLNAFGFKLKQEIVTAGDFFDMQAMSQGMFDTTPLNQPDDVENFTTKIEVKQPLINFDGFMGKMAAQTGVKAMNYKKDRVENYVTFMLKQVYYGLILARQSEAVINKAIEAATSNRDMAQQYFDEGYINKSDLLMAEVYVLKMKSKKAEIQNQIADAHNNLKFMLDINDGREIVPTDTLSIVDYNDPNYNLEEVNKSRSDMLAMKYRVKSLEKMVQMNYFKFLPRLNAFGSFEYNDQDAFGQDADSWMVGAMVSWDIFKGFSQIGDIKKAKAELRTAKVDYNKAASKNRVEIESALSALKTAQVMVELSEQSVAQTEEAYRIVSDRYEQGLEKTADLLIAEASMSGAKLERLKSLYDFNVAVFKLELLLEENITQ